MSLYIYHESTGTLIALAERVFLVNDKDVDYDILSQMDDGLFVPEWEHKGRRIDNYNMGHLFYGESNEI